MNRKLLSVVALAAGALLWASSADAAQITFGPSTQSVMVTGTGTGSVNVSIPALSGSASDTVTGGGGSFTMTAVSFTAGPGVGGTFPVNGTHTDTFVYTNGANSVTETLTFTTISDGTPNPGFNATSSVTAIAGSAAFQAGFGPVGSSDAFDMRLNNIGTTLNALSLTTNSASATVSSGEDTVTPAPEPASLTLLGSALIGLGWFARRRRTAV